MLRERLKLSPKNRKFQCYEQGVVGGKKKDLVDKEGSKRSQYLSPKGALKVRGRIVNRKVFVDDRRRLREQRLFDEINNDEETHFKEFMFYLSVTLD